MSTSDSTDTSRSSSSSSSRRTATDHVTEPIDGPIQLEVVDADGNLVLQRPVDVTELLQQPNHTPLPIGAGISLRLEAPPFHQSTSLDNTIRRRNSDRSNGLQPSRHNSALYSQQPADWETVLRTLRSEQSVLGTADPSPNREASGDSRRHQRMPYDGDDAHQNYEHAYDYDYNMSESDDYDIDAQSREPASEPAGEDEEPEQGRRLRTTESASGRSALPAPALNTRKLIYLSLLPDEDDTETDEPSRAVSALASRALPRAEDGPSRKTLEACATRAKSHRRHTFRPIMAAWQGMTAYLEPRHQGQRVLVYGGVTVRRTRCSTSRPPICPTRRGTDHPEGDDHCAHGTIVAEMQAYSLLSDHWQRVEGRRCVPAGHYGHAMVILPPVVDAAAAADAQRAPAPSSTMKLLLVGGIGPGGICPASTSPPAHRPTRADSTDAAHARAEFLFHSIAPQRPDGLGFVPLVFDMMLHARRGSSSSSVPYTWQAIQPAQPLSIAFHTAVARRREVIVFGGVTERWVVSGQLLVMDGYTYAVRLIHPRPCSTGHRHGTDQNRPTEDGRLAAPAPRYLHSAVLYRHYMIIHGGLDAHNNPLQDTWALDTRNYSWQQLPCHGRRPRAGHCACVVGRAMIVVGGMTSSLSHLMTPTDASHSEKRCARRVGDDESGSSEHDDEHGAGQSFSSAAVSLRRLPLCFDDDDDDESGSGQSTHGHAAPSHRPTEEKDEQRHRRGGGTDKQREDANMRRRSKDDNTARHRELWTWSSIRPRPVCPTASSGSSSSSLPSTLLFASAAPCGDDASFVVAGGLLPRRTRVHNRRLTWLHDFMVCDRVFLFRHPALPGQTSRASGHPVPAHTAGEDRSESHRIRLPAAQLAAFVRRQQDFLRKKSAHVTETQRRTQLRALEAMDTVLYLDEDEIARMLARSEACCRAFAEDFPVADLPPSVPDRAARVSIVEECTALSRQLRDVVRSMQGSEETGGGAVKSATHRPQPPQGTGRKTEDYSTAKPLRRVVIQDLLDRIEHELTRLRALNKGLRNSDWPDKERFRQATQHMRESVTALSHTMQRIVGRYVHARITHLTATRGTSTTRAQPPVVDDALLARGRDTLGHRRQGGGTSRGAGFIHGAGYFASASEAFVVLTTKQVRELAAAAAATERRAVAWMEDDSPVSPSSVLPRADRNKDNHPTNTASTTIHQSNIDAVDCVREMNPEAVVVVGGGGGGDVEGARNLPIVPVPLVVGVPTPPVLWHAEPPSAVSDGSDSAQRHARRRNEDSRSRSSRSRSRSVSSSRESSDSEDDRSSHRPMTTPRAPAVPSAPGGTGGTINDTARGDSNSPRNGYAPAATSATSEGTRDLTAVDGSGGGGNSLSAQRTRQSDAIGRAVAAVAHAAYDFAALLRARLLDTADETASTVALPAAIPPVSQPNAAAAAAAAAVVVPSPALATSFMPSQQSSAQIVPVAASAVASPPFVSNDSTTTLTTATAEATDNYPNDHGVNGAVEKGEAARASTRVPAVHTQNGVQLFLTSLTALAAAREQLASALRRYRPPAAQENDNQHDATQAATTAGATPQQHLTDATGAGIDTHDDEMKKRVVLLQRQQHLWQRARQLWTQLSALLQSVTTRFLAKAGTRTAEKKEQLAPQQTRRVAEEQKRRAGHVPWGSGGGASRQRGHADSTRSSSTHYSANIGPTAAKRTKKKVVLTKMDAATTNTTTTNTNTDAQNRSSSSSSSASRHGRSCSSTAETGQANTTADTPATTQTSQARNTTVYRVTPYPDCATATGTATSTPVPDASTWQGNGPQDARAAATASTRALEPLFMRPCDYLVAPAQHSAAAYDAHNTALLSEEEMVRQLRSSITAPQRRATGVIIDTHGSNHPHAPHASTLHKSDGGDMNTANNALGNGENVQDVLSGVTPLAGSYPCQTATSAVAPLRWNNTSSEAWLSHDALVGRGRYANDWALVMNQGDDRWQDGRPGEPVHRSATSAPSFHITAETVPAEPTGRLSSAPKNSSDDVYMRRATAEAAVEAGESVSCADTNLPLTSVGPGTFVVDAEVYYRHAPRQVVSSRCSSTAPTATASARMPSSSSRVNVNTGTSTTSLHSTEKPDAVLNGSADEDYFYFGRPLTRRVNTAPSSHPGGSGNLMDSAEQQQQQQQQYDSQAMSGRYGSYCPTNAPALMQESGSAGREGARSAVSGVLTRDPAGVRLPTSVYGAPAEALTASSSAHFSSHDNIRYGNSNDVDDRHNNNNNNRSTSSNNNTYRARDRTQDWITTSSTVGTALGSTRVSAQRRPSRLYSSATASAPPGIADSQRALHHYAHERSVHDGVPVGMGPDQPTSLSRQRSRAGVGGSGTMPAKTTPSRGHGMFKGALTPGEAAILRAREQLRRKPRA